MKKKFVFSKKQLQKHIKELIDLAKTVTPDVKTEVLIPGYEEQHAWLEIYVPDELEEQIEDMIGERATEILVDTGYDIGAIVYEKSQLLDVATAEARA